MRQAAEIFYGGYLEQEKKRVIHEAFYYDNVVLSEQEAEMILENQYYDDFYYIDYKHIQESVNNFSDNFVKEHYIAYKDILIFSKVFESEYDIIETKFAKGVAERVRKRFRLGINQVAYDFANNMVGIIGVFAVIDDNILLIEDFLKSEGYFPAQREQVIKPDDGTVWELIRFEPYTDAANRTYDEPFVYHISPQINRNSIDKYGLHPQTMNKLYSYPPRIYAFKYDTKYDIMLITYKRMAVVSEINNYDIYKIDISNIDNIFYLDPNCEEGVFTYEPIPKECIVQRMPILKMP